MNFGLIFIWLKFFGINLFAVPHFDLFVGTMLNKTLTYLIVFFLPIALVNYLLIFRKNRYKKFLDKYPLKKNNVSIIYTFIVVLTTLLTAGFLSYKQ
jgi:hypothetical protein